MNVFPLKFMQCFLFCQFCFCSSMDHKRSKPKDILLSEELMSYIVVSFYLMYFHWTIDLFANVSQIYGCFFPRDLVTSHFINLYLTNGISILGIHFAYISCCFVGQTLDKLSGCPEQPLLKWYA